MKKRLVFILILSLTALAIAASLGETSISALLYQRSTGAMAAAVAFSPDDLGLSLTAREEELFRLGVAYGYDYANGASFLQSPGSADTPSSETMVWIPTKGGKKYHKKESCSGMIDPLYVTISEAKRQGFDPCGRCRPPQ